MLGIEEKGLARVVRDAIFNPILPGAVAAVVVALAVWFWSGDGDHGTRRWEAGGNATETASFKELVKPSEAGVVSPLLARLGLAGGSGPIIEKQLDWSLPHVSVYSVPAPAPSQSLPNLRDLGEKGQAHAIDFLAKYPAREKETWAKLQEALRDKKDLAPGERDPFRFDRILVATVAKGTDWNPGDRMMWTRVFVEPINFSFAGYTVAATDNKQVKVTSVEATNTKKISAEIGLAIPELEGSKASLSPSEEHIVKRTSDVIAQYEKLGIDIMPHFLRVMRESEIGGDAVGNTLVSLSVVTDPIIIQRRYPNEVVEKGPLGEDVVLQVTGTHLEDERGELDRDHASITVMPQAPVPHCALRARLWMLYEERRIDKGDQYYEEARHTVSFLRGADEPRDVDFINPDDVSPTVWSIQVVDDDKSVIKVLGAHLDAHYVNGSSQTPPSRELVFTDYSQASKLAHWIRTHKEHQIRHLVFDYDGARSLVPVKNTNDVCVPGYRLTPRQIYNSKAKKI